MFLMSVPTHGRGVPGVPGRGVPPFGKTPGRVVVREHVQGHRCTGALQGLRCIRTNQSHAENGGVDTPANRFTGIPIWLPQRRCDICRLGSSSSDEHPPTPNR